MVKALTCKVTGVDLGSDGWPNEQEKYEEVPAGIYLAQSNMIVEGEISVYAAGEFDGEEEEDDDAVKVNDLVNKFQLMQCEGLSKKDFKAMFMGHVKKVMKEGKMKKKAKESEEGKAALDAFQKDAKEVLMFYLKVFKDCDIYMNEDQDAEGAYVVGWWNPESPVTTAPMMCYWLNGCDFKKL
jgi:hypothetical protein